MYDYNVTVCSQGTSRLTTLFVLYGYILMMMYLLDWLPVYL